MGQVGAEAVDLVKNGGFESDLANWNLVTLSLFYPADILFVVDGIPYEGTRSLRTSAIVSYEPGIRGEIYQVIDDKRLSFDSTLSFWVFPSVAADDMPTAHIWTYLLLHTSSQKQYRLAYHVAWETVAWPNYRDWVGNGTDTADFFLRTYRYEWNYVQRDLRRDFESRFGPTAGLQLSKVEIHIATSTKQPITPYRLDRGFVWWDSIKLLSVLPAKLDLTLTLTRSGTITKEASVGEEVQLMASLVNPSAVAVRDIVAEAIYPLGLRLTSRISGPSYLDPGSKAEATWFLVPEIPGNYSLQVRVSSSTGVQMGEISLSAKPKPSPAPQASQPGPEAMEAGTYAFIVLILAAVFAAGLVVCAWRRGRPRSM